MAFPSDGLIRTLNQPKISTTMQPEITATGPTVRKIICSFSFLLSVAALGQTTPEDLIKKGVSLFDARQYEAAQEVFEQVLELQPNNAMAMYELGYTEYALGHLEEAIEWADKAIDSQDPNTVEPAYLLKGSALDDLGNHKKAVKTYKAGAKDFPNSYLFPFNLGVSYFRNEDLEKAEEALLQSLSLNPVHGSSHYLLAQLKMTQGERIPALLAMQFFLVLEARSDRSADARDRMAYLIGFGVERQDERNISISLNPDALDQPFGTKDMMLSLKVAHIMGNDSLNAAEKELDILRSVLLGLGSDEANFWKQTYGSFFDRCEADGQFENMYYHSRSGSEADLIQSWLRLHATEMQEYYRWMEGLYR